MLLTDWSHVVLLNHEMGYTPHEVMVIKGHKHLKEVERYTKAAGEEHYGEVTGAKIEQIFPTTKGFIPNRFSLFTMTCKVVGAS